MRRPSRWPRLPPGPKVVAISSRSSPRRKAPEVSAVEKYDSEDEDATVTVKTKERRKNSQLVDTPASVS